MPRYYVIYELVSPFEPVPTEEHIMLLVYRTWNAVYLFFFHTSRKLTTWYLYSISLMCWVYPLCVISDGQNQIQVHASRRTWPLRYRVNFVHRNGWWIYVFGCREIYHILLKRFSKNIYVHLNFARLWITMPSQTCQKILRNLWLLFSI